MTGFCPGCFNTGFTGLCPHCGYRALDNESPMYLPPGTLLNGRYMLGRVLGAGGFGITYLALDRIKGEKCAVKEYLPAVLAVREPETGTVKASSRDEEHTFTHGLSVFCNESQVLMRFLGNASIVQVFDRFFERGTAYFVMEYLDGVNLKVLMKSMGGCLSVEFARQILVTLSRTLNAVHAEGLIHRDVSPENIFITREGQIKLIDFGATRLFVGEKSRSLSVVLKPGFAPPEQYSSKGSQGPWTDVYALCSTIYYCISGTAVPGAPERLAGEPLPPISLSKEDMLRVALERGLSLDYRNRLQTANDLLSVCNEQNSSLTDSHKGIEKGGTPYIELSGDGSISRYTIPSNVDISLGRSNERCNIIVDKPDISRIHCVISYDENSGMFYIIDTSSNGTFIGEHRLERDRVYKLKPGDEFYLLSYRNTVKVGLA